jgi:hypothetical protein
VTALAERDDTALARLVVAEPLLVDPGVVVSMLREPAGWLGEPVDQPDPSGMRRYAADLRLRVGDHVGVTTFRKAAYVDVAEPHRVPGGWAVEIGWRAATMAPLFPVFSGAIEVGADRIELTGIYAPPGGAVGRVADRALLNLAARGTGRWLLRELAAAARRAAA